MAPVNGVRVIGVRILRAPVTRRAWRELGYAILSVPLALLGIGYVTVSLVLGAVLAVTALGVPLLAAAVPGARALGRVRRALARLLLRENVAAPAPFRPNSGGFAWLRAGLRDLAGWRAIGYLVVNLPVSLLGLVAVVVCWVWGLLSFTYP